MPKNQEKFDNLLLAIKSKFDLYTIAESVIANRKNGAHWEHTCLELTQADDEEYDPDGNFEVDLTLQGEALTQDIKQKISGLALLLQGVHELTQDDLDQLLLAMAENIEFKHIVQGIIFSNSLVGFPFEDFPNLRNILLGYGGEGQVPVELATPRLSACPKLKSIYFGERILIGGWPDLSNNLMLDEIDISYTPMRYPPTKLPPSAFELNIENSGLVSLPNLSRKALPNFKALYYKNPGRAYNLTQATIIALKAFAASRGEGVREFVINGTNYHNVYLNEQMLDAHFDTLILTLQQSYQDKQLSLAPNSTKSSLFIFRYALLYSNFYIPAALLKQIVLMSDFPASDDFIEHIKNSAEALRDMIDEGSDAASKLAIARYSTEKLPATIAKAAKHTQFNPAFERYREETRREITEQFENTAILFAITELKARKLAREQKVPRSKQKINFTP